jgi:hypothetical protein
MEGLNPNNPPPKTTEVAIDHWEYTDPIGVPHPDVVDSIIEVKNSLSHPINKAMLTVTVEWNIGTRSTRNLGLNWESPELLLVQAVTVDSNSKVAIRVPLAIGEKMKKLEPSWPWVARIKAKIRSPDGKANLGLTTKDFHITPGD